MHKNITVDEVHQLLNTQDNNIILIDCREEQEYAECHISNTVLRPLSTFDPNQDIEQLQSASHIIIHCRSGQRSQTACNLLINTGQYNKDNIYNMDGGILDWIESGYEYN